MGEGCRSEAQSGEDGWQGGDYCGGDVLVVVGDGGGGVVVGGDGGCNASDSEFRLTLANGCDTACQGGGVVVVVVGDGDGGGGVVGGDGGDRGHHHHHKEGRWAQAA